MSISLRRSEILNELSTMKKWLLFFFALSLASVPAAAGERLFAIDCAGEMKAHDIRGMGTFKGVLPRSMAENAASWSMCAVTSEAREENGLRFVRITTQPVSMGGQFSLGSISIVSPGYVKLRVRARTHGTASLKVGLRHPGAPWTMYAQTEVTSDSLDEKTYVLPLKRAYRGPVGVLLYTTAGDVDFAGLTLETATEDDLAATIARPPLSVTDFARHARFPLGLPAGWNFAPDHFDATATADADAGTPDGVPALRVTASRPWKLCGEAFQTGHLGKPHTLRFRYKSDAPALAEVVGDIWWVVCGGQSLPATSEWREVSVVFRPHKTAKALGLRFSGGKGNFWLDQVRVHVGDGAAPFGGRQVALAVESGELAASRIQFLDEAPRVRVAAVGLPADARVRVTASDLYGREKEIWAGAAGELNGAKGKALDGCAFADAPVGQVLVTAWAERDGARLTADEELVVTRLPRPVAWGRDAPDSPFGVHVDPDFASVRALKAGGVNWVRLHDAGEKVSNWFAQEPEKGKWIDHDAEVACYRDAKLKIFAQLGTAPAWATHYGDLGYKKMGYFEKYLRPTNSVDWVNYVTTYVKRHEKDIDAYFVWNEPWGSWWVTAKDIDFFGKEKAVADYVAFSRLTYDAVKRVNPKIRVSGFNTFVGSGAKWNAEILANGGFEACDLIDWHFYTPNPLAGRGSRDITAEMLAPIRAKHPGLGGKPHWMSEGQGTSEGTGGVSDPWSGLLRASVPWPRETKRTLAFAGERTSRYILEILSRGAEKVFLYSAHAYMGLAQKPTFIVLLGADGFPHPSLVAHAQLAQAIEGRTFARREDAGRNGQKFVFRGRGGEAAVYVDLTEDEVRDLAKRARLVDLWGNPVDASRNPGSTLVYEVVECRSS